MKRELQKFYFFVLFLGFGISGIAQQTKHSLLFLENEPLEARLEFSIKEIKKNKSDTTFYDAQLYYKNKAQEWDSIRIRINGRGHFRRANCFFIPIKIKIKKKDNAGTIFEGNQNLKLVLPCQRGGNSNDLVVKEYLCYKLYEPISPYAFGTRLMDLTLTDSRNRKPTTYSLKAFVIEDDKQVAKRSNGKLLKGYQMNSLFMQDSLAALQDVFQYMIGNTDWSSTMQHNVKVMLLPSGMKVPIPYDYDMSGLVNAPYAQVNESMPIKNVRERHFRGFCRNEGMGEYVRLKYIELEPVLWKRFWDLEGQLNPREALETENYLKDFFAVVKNRKRFEENILQNCRKIE
jgi:hypothetical protein